MPPATKDVVQASAYRPFGERRACKGCRAIKSRCMRYPGSIHCSRCLRLKVDCEYPSHHRGVKPSVQPDQQERKDRPLSLSEEQQIAEKPFSIQSLLTTDETKESTLLLSTTFANIQQSRPRFDTLHPATSQVLPIGDIVSSKVISRKDAAIFIHFYYEHLNPIIALLDRQIYTSDNLQRRVEYQLLFASICTISAKFCMPESYQKCLDFIAPALSEIAAGETQSQLETILSLSLLAMWKHPQDGVSWRKLRLAVTLAFELGLQNSFTNQTESPTPSRHSIQAQRAFLQLACFEDGYRDQCRMPMSIDASFLPDPWKWIESLGDSVQDIDIRLAASRDNALIKQQLVRQLAEITDSSKAASLSKIRLIKTTIAAEMSNAEIWQDPSKYGIINVQHSGRPCLLFHNTNTLFNYHRALYSVYCTPSLFSLQEPREATFDKCCQLSIEIFQLFNTLYGENEYYRYVHDIVILNLAVAAVWISDNWHKMSVSMARQAIVAVFTAANITASSQNRKMEQSSYLARFLAFCTTKFSALLEESTYNSNNGDDDVMPSLSDQQTSDNNQWWNQPEGLMNSIEFHAAISPPDPTYIQPESHRYIEEILTAPCFQFGTDSVLDTNDILSFFQDPTMRSS